MTVQRLCQWPICLVLVVAALGCGGGDDSATDRPARTKASGVVTFKGAPVEGATVTLVPNTKDGQGAFGTTDQEGRFVLGTYEAGDGAVPGEYLVTVKKVEQSGSGSQPTPDDPNYDPTATPEPPKNLLPEKYADIAKSGLKATIGTDARDDLNFELVE